MDNGWIKLHRTFNNWEWKDSPKHVAVFLDLLLQANHKDNKYHGEIIPKGTLTTSYAAISKRTGVSYQSVRTVLNALKSTGEVTIKTTSKFSMISITKWDKYQLNEDHQQTNQQSTNNQLTTNKNVNNVKNINNADLIDKIIKYLNDKTCKNYRSKTPKTKKMINTLLSQGFKYEDFTLVIDIKSKEWLNNDKMNKYLRPETLFSNKFESYLNEKKSVSESDIEAMFNNLGNKDAK